jgi:hypothetical protein
VGRIDAACAAAPSAGPYMDTRSAVSVTMRLMVKPGMATEAVICQMSASEPAMTESSPAWNGLEPHSYCTADSSASGAALCVSCASVASSAASDCCRLVRRQRASRSFSGGGGGFQHASHSSSIGVSIRLI